MFGLFGRRRKRVIIIPGEASPFTYRQVFQRRSLPSPGAMNYSLNTLALQQYTPIGPSVRNRQAINPVATAPQIYAKQAVPLAGMPLVSGQMVSQPLFDPNSGYTSAIVGVLNRPFPEQEIAPAGAAI